MDRMMERMEASQPLLGVNAAGRVLYEVGKQAGGDTTISTWKVYW